ncbi:MAG: glutamine synthetase [Firmicutes bacterium]|nr:glutamine synthetase [Bacillota bacterium]
MKYTAQEVLQYVQEEDVKFIRLAFCDVFGTQKNIAIQPAELKRAFTWGIPIDASAVPGFYDGVKSDLFLKPDPTTLCGLPWRPETGKVVRMFCSVTYPDGAPFEADSRALLARAVEEAKAAGLTFDIGPEMEFYIFKTDENGNPTKIPCDEAGYLDIAPEDKGENLRREICLTLEQMGIQPEASYHEVGPGQNEIDFRYSDPVSAADNAVTFKAVVQTIAGRNGFAADFSPKPLEDQPGSGFHINFSIGDRKDKALLDRALAGILERIADCTLFFNASEESYRRLGGCKAPKYVSWSAENRSQLIRIPATPQGHFRAELRSADPAANPYLAFALLIYSCLYGIRAELDLCGPADMDLYTAPQDVLAAFEKLPETLEAAKEKAASSEFIRLCIPEPILNAYLNR